VLNCELGRYIVDSLVTCKNSDGVDTIKLYFCKGKSNFLFPIATLKHYLYRPCGHRVRLRTEDRGFESDMQKTGNKSTTVTIINRVGHVASLVFVL
jgi:hypothetical protein